MSCHAGPNIVKSGLILNLTAASKKSTIHSTNNLIDNSNWTTVGYNTLPWPSNGDGAQNELLFDNDPWDNSSLVLKTHPNNNGGNGGWEGCTSSYWVDINPSKKYRSCVWVRRTSTNTNGTFYHGLHTNGVGDVYDYNSASQTNPYWACQGIGYLTQNVWYLHVGHINPAGIYGVTDSTSGYWTRAGGWIANPGCNIGGDATFPSDATVLRNRVYHYYAASDANSNIELFYPRIDCIDGSEPSIQDILNNGPSTLFDVSGNNNHHYMSYKPVYDKTHNGQFTLDGSIQGFYRNSALNNASNSCTVVIWYKTTDIQELWVRGNQNNSYYLSASNNNNYYHGTCGSPTNYINLVSVSNPYTSGYKNGNYHMFEAKGADFSTWTYFEWFLYPNGWQMAGSVAKILVYNKSLSLSESQQNYAALRGRYGL